MAVCRCALLLLLAAPPQPVRAEPVSARSAVVFADPAFRALWRRTDDLAPGRRSFLWGPPDRAATTIAREPYAEAPGGTRLVEYFDKTRMERTDPARSRAAAGFVTNGLLATEMITGRVQQGDTAFESRPPAAVTIAGDAGDPDTPTYATFTRLMAAPPLVAESPITQTVDRAGTVGTGGPSGVTAGELVTETRHRTASVFRDFIFGSGPVLVGDQQSDAPLFMNGYAGGVGLPITEAYWARVRVGGVQKQVLVQAFERRVLTYTPDNPEGFKVEAGNVGAHYLRWRYGEAPPPAPNARIAFVTQSGGAPAALAVMDAGGTNRTTIVSLAADVRAPSWSPDGRRIAFAAGGKVYIADADGKNAAAVTDGPSDDLPAWSPDGRRIAFTRGGDLALFSTESRNVITLFAGVPGASAPAWSPDGARLAFTRGPDSWTIQTDGLELRRVLAGVGGAAFRSPSWTPDGTRLLATREAGGARTVIVVTADGASQRELIAGSGGVIAADGERVLVVTGGRISLTNWQGQPPRALSPDGVTDSAPAWSP